jgi:hypothetical protein
VLVSHVASRYRRRGKMHLLTRCQFHQLEAFMRADPKSAKKTNSLTAFFVLLESVHTKAVGKVLVKSTQRVNFTREH